MHSHKLNVKPQTAKKSGHAGIKVLNNLTYSETR